MKIKNYLRQINSFGYFYEVLPDSENSHSVKVEIIRAAPVDFVFGKKDPKPIYTLTIPKTGKFSVRNAIKQLKNEQ